MKKTRPIWLCLAFCLTSAAFSQPKNAYVIVSKLTDSVYRFFLNENMNLLVMTGPDGALLVDSGPDSKPIFGYANAPAAVLAELKKLGAGEVRYIINTHTDLDHAYGNAEIGSRATVIAQRLGRERLARIPDLPAGLLADITVQDSLTLYLNNDRIDLYCLPGHTNHDLVVYFHNAKVVCVGDLIIPDSFGSISATGNVQSMIRAMDWLYNRFTDEITFVAGHDRPIKRQDIKNYQIMIQKTLDLITQAIKKNKSVEEMQQQDLLKDWKSWNGVLFKELNADRWIRMIYANVIRQYKSSLVDYYADRLQQSGAAAARLAALEKYKNEKEKYFVSEFELNILGYRYLGEKNMPSALAAFNLAVELYPGSWNVYDSLGEACLAGGDTVQAIKSYQKALQLNNNAESAKNALRELGQKL